jgi:hypothetical protein
MAKFIKLSNTREDLKGAPLYFNTDHITCIYNVDGPLGEKTFIYGGNPAQTWEVEETAKQIMKLIDNNISEK